MHLLIKFIFATLILSLLYSCQTSDEQVEPTFDIVAEYPHIKEYNITEILKPIDMVLNNNYLCFLHDENSGKEQIFVFDANNLDFLYKFAKKGSGPEETLALDLVKSIRGDSIDLIDQSNYKKLTYVLTPDSAILAESKYLELPQMGPLQESYWLNDSVMIFNTNDGDLLTYDDKNNTIIDHVNISNLINGIPTDDVKKFGSFNFSTSGNDVFVGFRFFNNLFKIKLNDDFNFIRNNDLSVSPINLDTRNIFDNYGYYSFLNTKGNYVLAQYYGFKLQELQPFPKNLKGRNLKYNLILFDNNLKPLHNFKTNMNILRAFLDDNKKRIYFWDAFEDFEHLKYIEF
ncbi:MAG: hypothetical protein NC453_14005 [Muribaculum sp.]|nr:hypothetical protein [Muribaculum sp.]